MIQETDYAWAAGIIDGEGSINMTKAKPTKQNRRKTPGFQLRVFVKMTHKETIYNMKRIFGGSVCFCKSRNPLKHKDTYCWTATDILTKEVLNNTIKYMITKKQQAELGLRYFEDCGGVRIIGRSCPDSVVAMREKYFSDFTALNKKGPSNDSELTVGAI